MSSRLSDETRQTRDPIVGDVAELHGILAQLASKHCKVYAVKEVDTLAAFMCAVKAKGELLHLITRSLSLSPLCYFFRARHLLGIFCSLPPMRWVHVLDDDRACPIAGTDHASSPARVPGWRYSTRMPTGGAGVVSERMDADERLDSTVARITRASQPGPA